MLPVKEKNFGLESEKKRIFNERENLESLNFIRLDFRFRYCAIFSRCGNKLDPDIDSEESQKEKSPAGF